MVSTKFKVSWKTVLLPVVGIVAFFVYLYVFNVDIPTIIAIAGTADLSLYVFAAALVVLDTFFFSLAWHSLLNYLSVKLSILKAFLFVWYGMFVDIVIPAESVSAEISKIYLVTREQDGATGKVVASLAIQRLIGMGLNILGLLAGAGLLITTMQISGFVLNLILFLAAASIVSLFLFALLCTRETWTLKAIDKIMNLIERISRGRWNLATVRQEVVRAASMFHESMRQIRYAPKTVMTSLLFSVVAWLFSISVGYVVFLSVGFEVNWSVIIIAYSIISAIHGIPFGIPFEAGLPEITMTALYSVMLPDIPFSIIATVTILTRILTVWLRFFVGFAVQQALEIKAITTPKIFSQPEKT
jgi:uncharacterized protein (TIRG00374 family)